MSSGPKPNAKQAMCKALVALLTATAYLEVTLCAKAFSKAGTTGP